MFAYICKSGDSHLLIKKFVKIHKCHRNIRDQEVAYLERLLAQIEGHVEEVKEERASLLEEETKERGRRRRWRRRGPQWRWRRRRGPQRRGRWRRRQCNPCFLINMLISTSIDCLN